MPRKTRSRPVAGPVPPPQPPVPWAPESELEIAIRVERLAIAMLTTMTGGYRSCSNRSCRRLERCLSSARTDLCKVPHPDWLADLAYSARHVLRRFVDGGG
jgi:hypothetical protein